MKLPHKDWVWDVAFSPDRKFVLTASKDTLVKVWDAETAQQIGAPLDHPHPIWGLAFHPDGKTLFTLCCDPEKKLGELRVWSAEAERPGHLQMRGAPMKFAGDVFGLQMNGPGDRLWVTTYEDGQASLVEFTPDGAGSGLRLLASFDGAHMDAAFSPDGATLATIVGPRSTPSKRVQLWNARTGAPLDRSLEHPGSVRAVAFSKTGNFLIVGAATDLKLDQGETSRLHVWDWAQGKRIAQSQPLFGRVRTMAAAPNGQMFAVSLYQYLAGRDPKQLQIISTGTWQLLAIARGRADRQLRAAAADGRTPSGGMEFQPGQPLVAGRGAQFRRVSMERVELPAREESDLA